MKSLLALPHQKEKKTSIKAHTGLEASFRLTSESVFIARKHVKQDSNVNEEWKSMFGSLEPPNIPQALPKGSDQEVMQTGKPPRSESSAGICVPLSTSPQVLSPRQQSFFCLLIPFYCFGCLKTVSCTGKNNIVSCPLGRTCFFLR